MLTNKDYCDYEICVALKELGYDGCPWECSCFGAYYRNGEDIFYDRFFNSELGEDEYLRIPLYLAQKWLRENHNLHVEVGYNPVLSWYVYRVWEHQDEIAEGETFPSYEEALSTAIYMAIEYLKEEK